MNNTRLKVVTIIDGSSAQEAGLAVGDILESCNRVKLHKAQDLEHLMSRGISLCLKVIRDGFFYEIGVKNPDRLGIEVVEADCQEELVYQELIDKVDSFHGLNFYDLLSKHLGHVIWINSSKATGTDPAVLVKVSNEFFTVLVHNCLLTFPHTQITRLHSSLEFNSLTVIVDHFIAYKGGTHFGLHSKNIVKVSTDQ